MWVTDLNNYRVEEFSPSSTGYVYKMQLGGCSSGSCSAYRGSATGTFNFPTESAFDSGGNVWVSDSSFSRIEEFDPTSGKYEGELVGVGTGYDTGSGLAFDSMGNAWVSHIGSDAGEYEYSLSNNGALLGDVSQYAGSIPQGIVFDSLGNMWVADTGGDSIVEFNPSGDTYIPSGYQLGCNGPGACTIGTGSGQFNNPFYAAFDHGGNMWVSDNKNNRVQEFRPSGTTYVYNGQIGCGVGATSGCATSTSDGWFSNPTGIAIY